MKVSATIQARTGSQRLPEKVLLPILGDPMIARQIERIRKMRLIDEVIIATTTNPADDRIEDLAHKLGVACFRGSEDLVLDRVIEALKFFSVDAHVSFSGDCPLLDPTIVDSVVEVYLENKDVYDFVCTGLTTTFPAGLDVTVYSAEVLYDVDRLVTNPAEREHVGVHIKSRPKRYRILNIQAPPRYRHPDLFLEVDSAEDFEVVRVIYEALYPTNPDFQLPDIVNFMNENPVLAESNRDVQRRWKEFRSEDAVEGVTYVSLR